MKLKDINKKWIERTNNISLLKQAKDIIEFNNFKTNLIPLIDKS
jgi:hypothetical protein